MKKKILLITFALCIAFGVKAYAATFNSTLVLEEQKEKVVVSLNLKDSDGEASGLNALMFTFEYDKNSFEEVKQSDFAGKGNWGGIVYNPENGKVILDSSTAAGREEKVLEITLTPKVKQGTTKINLKEFTGSNGTDDFDSSIPNLSLNIDLKVGTNEENNNNNITNETGNNIININNVVNTNNSVNNTVTNIPNYTNTSNTNTSSPNVLPKAGMGEGIVIASLIIAYVCISYLGYKQYVKRKNND